MSKRLSIKVYEEAGHLRLVLKHNTAISLRHLKILKGREGAICAPLVAATWGTTGSTTRLTLSIIAPLPDVADLADKGAGLVVMCPFAS
jgi:hypothetical protein